MLNPTAVRECLKRFDFQTLFREHLGWDKHVTNRDVSIGDTTYSLNAIAEKAGYVAFLCQSIPDRATRLKIDREVSNTAREHFVVYADQSTGQQIWSWVRRDPDKPVASREQRFDASTSGEALIQRLEHFVLHFDDNVSILEMERRARRAFDVEKVTKKFYDRFTREHDAFLKHITGLPSAVDKEWYTSLTLNRLMFVYFIQKKGFLDGNINYLEDRLQKVRESFGKDHFQSFYRYFLIRLFQEGLGTESNSRTADPSFAALLGDVPYLNGGFFEAHQLEHRYPDLDIPDAAFRSLFAFFDDFSWHLDDRPSRTGKEINPDVVGYIFEKYINQKELGAYYTKEDITQYICKNTIIQYLFREAERHCPIAFAADAPAWRMIADDPDAYIYPALSHGIYEPSGRLRQLPADVAIGLTNPKRREAWNRVASSEFGLPTETWREFLARRERCISTRSRLARGEILRIKDFTRYNLDIWQFARHVIERAEGPELLRAFWLAIRRVRVLDPTCGSGAFLFAALRVLESLYGDCLSAMQRMVADADLTTDVTPESEARRLLDAGETRVVERKACAFQHPAAQSPDKSLIGEIAIAVASFLNTEGGDVLVGVSNTGAVLGVEADIASVNPQRKDEDSYLLWIQQKLEASLGADLVAKVRLSVVTLDGKRVARIGVSKSARPVYLTVNGRKEFYVRAEKGRMALDVEETSNYVLRHFQDAAVATAKESPRRLTGRRFLDFRAILDSMQSKTSPEYAILKTIIVNNLYGVDLMDEAVEICKLRLFLKLASQVSDGARIEPLPDIDFNVRSGNSLVGYASLDSLKASHSGTLGFDEDQLTKIAAQANDIRQYTEIFRSQQAASEYDHAATGKAQLTERLDRLNRTLNSHLAREYGIDYDTSDPNEISAWERSHRPFHWIVDFNDAIEGGGFDVIIGNPPYVEYSKVRSKYRLTSEFAPYATNLYSACIYRNTQLASPRGLTAFIVPVSLPSTDRMEPARELLISAGGTYFTSFSTRPSKLFDGAEQRLTIYIQTIGEDNRELYSGGYLKWNSEERETLFDRIEYVPVLPVPGRKNAWPKLRGPMESAIFSRMQRQRSLRQSGVLGGSSVLYYKNTGLRYFSTVTLRAPRCWINGIASRSSRETTLRVDEDARHAVHAFLLSSTFFFYYQAMSNCRDLNPSDISEAPFDEAGSLNRDLTRLSLAIEQDCFAKARMLVMNNKKTGEVRLESVTPARSKELLDQIDETIAPLYGFTAEELDYILNLDAKYRSGVDDDA